MMIWPGTSIEYTQSIKSSKIENLKEHLDNYIGEPFGCGHCDIERYENNSWLSDTTFGTRHTILNNGNFLRVIIKHNPECKCKLSQNCINAIVTGKCTDKFVNEIFGKILFSRQYSN
ncbi:MAG: hypothetical protein J5714_04530 [Alphaproteobacteria bacterium]|nr:hypothetical protein [Alphaproteobacteria bacterium]